VVTNIPVFREYLTDGAGVLITPPSDPAALAAALNAILTDRSLAERLSAAGPTVARRFPWSESAEQHRAVYDRLALTPRPAAR
jgi:glycosyltransferase involved in cell wall biosynthesis